jgi:hypothetical protein
MKELATEETPIVKMKAIALASVFATSSTLALAGVGSVELPVWASPSDISSSHFNLGNVAPGNPAVERMQRAAPQRGDYPKIKGEPCPAGTFASGGSCKAFR